MKVFVVLNLLEYIGSVQKVIQLVIISDCDSLIILATSPPCGINCD